MTKHAGKAGKAAFRILFWTMVLLLAVLAGGALIILISKWIVAITPHLLTISAVLVCLWALFAAFTLYFFRDPTPLGSTIPGSIVAPAHGKIDLIDETHEPEFMGGPCQRVSIFLSVLDVHVQRSPVSGHIAFHKHTPGRFLSATRTQASTHNENLLLGFQIKDYPNQKIAVRLVAGLLARRILLWAEPNEPITRSERISLIQFGSRCDLYLPLGLKLHVKRGDKAKAGETIVASFD